MDRETQLENDWKTNPRWQGIRRNYTAADVLRISGSESGAVEYTRARKGAERLWELLNERPYVQALGAICGEQAKQMVLAGLEAVYVSGWQVAAGANVAGETYPDMSLYPYNSVPMLVEEINKSLTRFDEIMVLEGKININPFVPLVADAEAGFGGVKTGFELMKMMIYAGAAGVHYEDQLGSEKKCGHMGGKVLVPTSQFISMLNAARLASDRCNVPTVLIARTDADSARLITSDVDEMDSPYIDRTHRTQEGYYTFNGGLEAAIARAVAYAPYADLLWCETSTPDLKEAKIFAEGVHEKFPGKMLMYNCSPSFNWRKNLDDATIAKFQQELSAMGYKFQFVTLAGWHALCSGIFKLAHAYRKEGMTAYVRLQQEEIALEEYGYTATKHQREVGAGYFDELTKVLSGENATTALEGSTEQAQFRKNT